MPFPGHRRAPLRHRQGREFRDARRTRRPPVGRPPRAVLPRPGSTRFAALRAALARLAGLGRHHRTSCSLWSPRSRSPGSPSTPPLPEEGPRHDQPDHIARRARARPRDDPRLACASSTRSSSTPPGTRAAAAPAARVRPAPNLGALNLRRMASIRWPAPARKDRHAPFDETACSALRRRVSRLRGERDAELPGQRPRRPDGLAGSARAAAPAADRDHRLWRRPAPGRRPLAARGAPGPHPIVLMVHGGCWQTEIADRTIMNWIADDLRAARHRGLEHRLSRRRPARRRLSRHLPGRRGGRRRAARPCRAPQSRSLAPRRHRPQRRRPSRALAGGAARLPPGSPLRTRQSAPDPSRSSASAACPISRKRRGRRATAAASR